MQRFFGVVVAALVLATGAGTPAWPAAPTPAGSTQTVLPVPAADAALLEVRPDHANWLYALGEAAELRIDGPPGARVRYRLGMETREGAPVEAVLPAGGLRIPVASPAAPGFVRIIASLDGKPGAAATATVMVTLGFSPERIIPTQTEPADFDAFWRQQKTALDAIAPDYRLTPAPELSNDAVEVFYLRYRMFPNWGGPSYFHGVLSVPRGAGPYPVVLYLPGAGVRPYVGQKGMARHGVITLELGVHGIALNYPRELYAELDRGALDNYNRFNIDNRDTFYYRRVYLGVMRGADFLAGLLEWNGRQFIVTGASQGGQLSLMLAGFDRRVTGVAAAYPAFSDVTGYLHDRAGGWPGLFRQNADGSRADEPVEPKRITTSYYDSVNFARRIRVPGYYFMGFNDTVTPPTSVFAALNAISAPRQLVIAPEQGHRTSPAQQGMIDSWILGQLRLRSAPE